MPLIAASLLLTGPMPQDPGYHDFADQRPVLGIPHGLNVLSNSAFLLVAGLGFASLRRWHPPHGKDRLPYQTLCVGLIGVALGSGYYHLDPDTPRLFWDRLAMAVTFAALFAAVLNERLPAGHAPKLVGGLCTLAALSAGYWLVSEWLGRGDLRPYLLVQGIPILLTPVLVLCCRSRHPANGWLLTAVALYLVALAFDLSDAGVYQATGGTVSGHTVKHLVAALAALCVVLRLRRLPSG
nr:alkaline phytoceramidase [Methylonatrum kenyense]